MRKLPKISIALETHFSPKKWDRLIKIATDLSFSCESRCKHISILLYKNKIVSHGINMLKTDTFAYKIYKYAFIHSELNAIKKCPPTIDIGKCTLINFRFSKDGSRCIMSRPCPSCIKLIDGQGIKKVYYTTNNSEIVEL